MFTSYHFFVEAFLMTHLMLPCCPVLSFCFSWNADQHPQQHLQLTPSFSHLCSSHSFDLCQLRNRSSSKANFERRRQRRDPFKLTLREGSTLRNLEGECIANFNIKELKQLKNRVDRAISRIRSKKHEMLLADIEYMQKKEMELEHENSYLRAKIMEAQRMQQVSMIPISHNDLTSIHAFEILPHNMLDAVGTSSYSANLNIKPLQLG